jgi:hypothetical protein
MRLRPGRSRALSSWSSACGVVAIASVFGESSGRSLLISPFETTACTTPDKPNPIVCVMFVIPITPLTAMLKRSRSATAVGASAAIGACQATTDTVFQTHCPRHRAPLIERCGVCFVEDPLLPTQTLSRRFRPAGNVVLPCFHTILPNEFIDYCGDNKLRKRESAKMVQSVKFRSISSARRLRSTSSRPWNWPKSSSASGSTRNGPVKWCLLVRSRGCSRRLRV